MMLQPRCDGVLTALDRRPRNAATDYFLILLRIKAFKAAGAGGAGGEPGAAIGDRSSANGAA